MYDLNTSDPGAGPSTPSRRSRLADRTSSLLSQLHPSGWVRNSTTGSGGHAGHGGHPGGGAAAAADEADALRSSISAANALINKAAVTSPATMAHSREKAKRWVRG